MAVNKINPRFAILLLFMVVVGLLRILNAIEISAWSNFTPIGAMGIFGGAYFDRRWKAFAFTLITLLIGDVIIQTLIHKGTFSARPPIYFAFFVIVLIGITIIKSISVKRIALASVLSAISFWLIADFAVWAGGGIDIRTQTPLSRDFAGLMQCYWQGFPFMINFLLGTIFYSALMFGSFEFIQRKFPALQSQSAKPGKSTKPLL